MQGEATIVLAPRPFLRQTAMPVSRSRAGTPDFIRALCEPVAYAHPAGTPRLVETHISWVLLTGAFAYKIKKPVNLGFLDFSTLEKRRQACEDELRLNRRFAPELYLEVVPVTGSPQQPRMNGAGKPFEYAVRMREFPQADQLDRRLAAGQLGLEDMDALARRLADFHAAAPVAPVESPYGEPLLVQRAARENFELLLAGATGDLQTQLQVLCDWSETHFETLRPLMLLRKDGGFVREVHGDLHLANLVRMGTVVVPFDCIEFSAELRWVDVLSDIAFLLMDLQFRGHPELAYRLLNRYLEANGDYEALPLLPYYRVYRALVRAKVAKIRRKGSTGLVRQNADAELHAYTGLACRWIQPTRPRLLLMHGLSGSGKSWLSDRMTLSLPAIRLRSDLERKRLFGLAADESSGSGLDSGIYGAPASARTYERLAALARAALAGGETVIVDAAFLKREQRARFRALAGELGLAFGIVECSAQPAELDRRLAQRARGHGDPSEADRAVLERQRATVEPLTADERAATLALDTTGLADEPSVTARLKAWAESLSVPG
jgi:aminoglycoside phosphotransferase family enzyme/predicted kinase